LRRIGGRVVEPAAWHVTLCFLGAVQDSGINALLTQAAGIRAAPFTLQFDGLETFRSARVLAATVSHAPPEARALVQALHRAARELGLTPDDKPWHPHVTLARSISAREQAVLAPLAMPVASFQLAASLATRQPRYASLASWPLRPT
jgi:2'-5' RNA ligase